MPIDARNVVCDVEQDPRRNEDKHKRCMDYSHSSSCTERTTGNSPTATERHSIIKIIMARTSSIEDRLAEVARLSMEPDTPEARKELRKHLSSKTSLIVAK